MNDRTRLFIVIIAIIALAVIGVVRLSQEGRIPLQLPSLQNQTILQGQKTVTVVDEQNAIVKAVDNTSPSVVAIGVTESISNSITNPFDPFSQQQQQQQLPSNQPSTIGTGFIAANNIIITNKHVVSDTSQQYSVVTKDGKKLAITNIYRDPVYDLAIVQVKDTAGLKPLTLGDSSNLKPGQTAIAIGNALGSFENTVTTGVVSGLNRSVTAGDESSGATENLQNLIQTDAAINPGNSGGPLLNIDGQVIGVNVATSANAQNIGFAIPINTVKTLVDQFQKNGTVAYPYMGVSVYPISQDYGVISNLPPGAYVESVVSGSPADKAGIKQGDVITKVDGTAIDEQNDLSSLIRSKKVGQTISLEVWSSDNNKTNTVKVTLAQFPSGQ